MTHDEALKILLDEIDMQKEIYSENDLEQSGITEAIKFACSCICREMKKK
jgi:hypothetical protein